MLQWGSSISNMCVNISERDGSGSSSSSAGPFPPACHGSALPTPITDKIKQNKHSHHEMGCFYFTLFFFLNHRQNSSHRWKHMFCLNPVQKQPIYGDQSEPKMLCLGSVQVFFLDLFSLSNLCMSELRARLQSRPTEGWRRRINWRRKKKHGKKNKNENTQQHQTRTMLILFMKSYPKLQNVLLS